MISPTELRTAKTSFVWCFVGLSFIAGTAFGYFGIAKDPTMGVILIFPGALVVISTLIGVSTLFDINP